MSTPVPAAARTLAVFEIFAREKRELSHTELARLLGVADSSCTDLLQTLQALGYLLRNTTTRRFYPSARLLEIGREITENDPLAIVAQEAVGRLVALTNESAFFGVSDPAGARVAAALPSRRPLRYIVDVGERVAVHASAFGKALLGSLPSGNLPAEVAKLSLRRITPHTITDAVMLVADVEAGRERGWYEARGEGNEGVTGLAVAGALGGRPVSISLAGPTERIDRNRESYLAALREVRDALLSGQ